MDRATKLFVFGWAVAALAFEVSLVSRGWGALVGLSTVTFLLAALGSAFEPRVAAFVLIFTYVFPVLIRLASGGYASQFDVLWLAGVLGVMTPAGLRTSWHLPARWRAPLVCWALIVAVGAAIVVGRELDFNAALLSNNTLWSSIGGLAPPNVVIWVVHVALLLVIGILWFDWLLGTTFDFHAWIVAPMALSAVVMALVAVYQMFGDVTFLNETVFGGLGRASGTVFDGNICGAVAALWIGAAFLCASRVGRWRSIVLLGVPLGWLAVWSTGSRTAFASATLITIFGAGASFAGPEGFRLRMRHVVPAVAIAAGLVVMLAYAQPSVVGPLSRVRATLPGLSAPSIRNFIEEAWNRNRYGQVATAMIRQSPFFGMGVGSFQVLLPDFAWSEGMLVPDNAQNWYRHQFAEFGLIGSLGWVVWLFGFAWFVLSYRRFASQDAWTARGMLIAFALVSIVGMPAQESMVMLTFWTVAFWYVSIVGVPERGSRLSARSWAVVVGVLLLYAGGTAEAAVGRLRVPVRAQMRGWPYSYGFYDPESDGTGGVFRWTGRRAVAVVDATARGMVVTVSTNHRDVGERPVDARVWCNGKLVADAHLVNTDPVTKYVRLPDEPKRVLIETWASRVERPSDAGGADDRELGVMVQWKFAEF